jgi:hypothetical protein
VTATTIVYVACAGSREIHCFTLDTDKGALTPVDVVTVPGGHEPSPSNMPMALAPGGTTLYVALRTAPFPVTAFAIDAATGRLRGQRTAPLPAPMAYIRVGAEGRFLMGASYKEGKLSVSEIAPDGVQAPPVHVVTTPPKAHCIIPGNAKTSSMQPPWKAMRSWCSAWKQRPGGLRRRNRTSLLAGRVRDHGTWPCIRGSTYSIV